MTEREKNIDEKMSAAMPSSAAKTLSALESAGFEAYVVGGCVRDVMLGKQPHDWDVTTSATPDQMKAAVPYKSFDSGIKHGTITFMVDGDAIEVTVYRTDGEYSDGRHPDSIEFASTVEEDLARRDFTVNAMAWSPVRGLADPFHGVDDLESNLLRCVGDPKDRFNEDGLRVMRALRFSAVYGFAVEEKTAQAVHECRDMLGPVAMERINAELVKMLAAPDGNHLAYILDEFHDVVFEFVPELAVTYDYDQGNEHHAEDLWHHMLHVMAGVETTDPMVRFSALVHDIGKPSCRTEGDDGNAHYYRHMVEGKDIVQSMMERLKFSRAETDEVTFMVSQHDNRPTATARSVRRFIARCGNEERARKLIDIMKSDARSHSSEKALAAVGELEEVGKLMESEFSSDAVMSMKDMAFSGHDLMEMGWEPGPEMGNELKRVFAAVVDGELENTKEAIAAEVTRNAEKQEKDRAAGASPFGVSLPMGSSGNGVWVRPHVRGKGIKVRGHWRGKRS